jgi:twinkle protein
MAHALQFVFHFVSHLATPEGRPHEEAGRVQVKHFRGSRAIGFWSHNILGIERNTQEPGNPMILRCLKDRFTGQSNGMTFGLAYDPKTGLLSECDVPSAFGDETSGNTDF